MSILTFDTTKDFTGDYGEKLYVIYTDAPGRCGIVEIMGDGYVIAAYVVREADGESICELHEVGDRLTKADVHPDNMMRALKYGREIAELAIRVKGDDV